MKTKLLLIAIICSATSLQARTLFQQMCAFNPNWKNYEVQIPRENERFFTSDQPYIQAHLGFVLEILKTAELKDLNAKQQIERANLIEVLGVYREAGIFPVNYYCSERIPVFIDEMDRHCAVGYLMKMSGYEKLAQKIAKQDNYIWVKDISDSEAIAWQQFSGFTFEELKLIQGAYDSYMPYAMEAPNRIEIPQKPEVITVNFEAKDLAQSKSLVSEKGIWIRGEGANGILNGRWEQNFSPSIPWIVGHYKEGKRTGRWLEYYRGTNIVCRTEYWDEDKLNGTRTRFDQSGNVIEKIQFKDGKAVLKTNYDASLSLKYVRKPLEYNKVWTEIYDLYGSLIAKGTETINNPGNLQWFQNIELTSLNMISLASQSYSNGDISSKSEAINYYNEPKLVEYIKESDWVYYSDFNESNVEMDVKKSDVENFILRFKRYGNELYYGSLLVAEVKIIPEFDSIAVSYSAGNITDFDGYSKGKKTLGLKLEWYDATPFDPNMVVFRRRYVEPTPVVKRCGSINENDERIGKWKTFNEYRQLIKIEEFIVPEKIKVVGQK